METRGINNYLFIVYNMPYLQEPLKNQHFESVEHHNNMNNKNRNNRNINRNRKHWGFRKQVGILQNELLWIFIVVFIIALILGVGLFNK